MKAPAIDKFNTRSMKTLNNILPYMFMAGAALFLLAMFVGMARG